MYSQHHRGTQETPGLVLGLDAGGQCFGIAFRIAPNNWSSVCSYLNQRELIGNYAYMPKVVKVMLAKGPVAALTYLSNPEHPNYAGPLPIETAVAVIMRASGVSGSNRDYLIKLVRKLKSLGYHDSEIHTLLRHIERTAENDG